MSESLGPETRLSVSPGWTVGLCFFVVLFLVTFVRKFKGLGCPVGEYVGTGRLSPEFFYFGSTPKGDSTRDESTFRGVHSPSGRLITTRVI